MSDYSLRAKQFSSNVNQFHMLIFQHLSVSDLINLTLVLPAVNDTISSCAHCMCRIQFCMPYDKFIRISEPRQMPGHNKSRKYRNFSFVCSNDVEMSEMCLSMLKNYAQSATNLELIGMKFEENLEIMLTMPNLLNLKIGSTDLRPMLGLLMAGHVKKKLVLSDIQVPINDTKMTDAIMSFKTVRLLNVKISCFTNIDFLFNNCIDFETESDQLNDFDDPCLIFQNVISCSTLTIRKKNSVGFKLTIHRKKEDIFNKLKPLMFERKYKPIDARFLIEKVAEKRNKYNKIDQNVSFPVKNFIITLEVNDLSWTMLEKLGGSLPKLKKLKIYNVTDEKKLEIFTHFKRLEMITVVGDDEMEAEMNYRRSEFEIKPSRDPLICIHPNLRHLIFQHFTTDDFQFASQVSPKWLNIFNESAQFNEKFIFTLTAKEFNDKSPQELVDCKRFIQNFQISASNNNKASPNIISFLHNYSQFIVELNFHEVRLKSIDVVYYLVFPRLEILRLNRVDEKFCKTLFVNLTSLKELSLQTMMVGKNFTARISSQTNLKKLIFRTCMFYDIKCFETKNVEYFEISNYDANAWKKEETHIGVDVIRKLNLMSLKSLKIANFRHDILQKFLDKAENLENLEIVGLWTYDFEKLGIYHKPINLFVPSFEHVDDIPWRKCFRKLKTIFASSIEKPKNLLSEHDRNFKRMMKTSGSRMIQARTYQLETITLDSNDPFIVLPEDIHELIFQHFDAKDVLNLREVSQNWRFYAGNSKSVMEKFHIRIERSRQFDVDAIKGSPDRYQNVTCHSPYLNLIERFCGSTKNLTIYMDNPVKFDGLNLRFPNLEVLKILSTSSYASDGRLKKLLNFFRYCRKIKILIIKENIQTNDVQPIKDLLISNPNLTEIRFDNVHGFKEFLHTDFFTKFTFQLKRFSFGLPPMESFRGTRFEENLLNFLQFHAETLEEIRISHGSALLYHDFLTNFTALNTLYTNSFANVNDITCPPSRSILRMMIPFSSHDSANILMQRVPLVEYLHVNAVDSEILRSAALLLPCLKVLSYYEEKDHCLREYEQIVAQNQLVNREMTFAKVERVKFENFKFEKIFGRKDENPYIFDE